MWRPLIMLLRPECPPSSQVGNFLEDQDSLQEAERSRIAAHLEDCDRCRWEHLKERRTDRSRPLAWIATGLFGALGLAVVLVVSFRHTSPLTIDAGFGSVPVRNVSSPPNPKPAENSLTSVRPPDAPGEAE